MTELEKAIEAISAQQANVKQKGLAFYVGEQLKDIIRETPGAAELVNQDLQAEKMGIADCEKQIGAFARQNGGCCPPMEADRIIREFYGLPDLEAKRFIAPEKAPEEPKKERKRVSLADFL